MSYFGNSDFMLEVARGNVTGFSQVNKFGENQNIASGTTEDIWDGGGTYVYPSTADITHVSMAADQVAARGETIEVQGLDTDWALTVQDLTLDASDTTTAVALTTALKRIFRMKVNANVVLDQDLAAHNVGDTQDYAIILAGNNQTLMSLYTIPAGKTAYVLKFYASQSRAAAKDPDAINIRSWARDNVNGYAFQLKHSLNLSSGGVTTFERIFGVPLKMAEKTDLRMTAGAVGQSAWVSSGFDLVLVDN